MLLPTEVLIQNIKNRITVDKDYDSNDEYESIYGDTNGLTHFKHSRTGTYQFFGWYLKGRPLACVIAYPELMGAEKNQGYIETALSTDVDNAILGGDFLKVRLKNEVDFFERMELEFENYGWSLDEILKVNMLLGFSLNVQKLWFWSALKRFGQISQHNPDTVMLFELGGVIHPISIYLEYVEKQQGDWTPFQHMFDDGLIQIIGNRITEGKHFYSLLIGMFTIALARWSQKELGNPILNREDSIEAKKEFMLLFEKNSWQYGYSQMAGEAAKSKEDFLKWSHKQREYENERKWLSNVLVVKEEIITRISMTKSSIDDPYFFLKILMECTKPEVNKGKMWHWSTGLKNAAEFTSKSAFLIDFIAKYCFSALAQSKFFNTINSLPLSKTLMVLDDTLLDPASNDDGGVPSLEQLNPLSGVQNISQAARIFNSILAEKVGVPCANGTGVETNNNLSSIARIVLRLLDDRFMNQCNDWLSNLANHASALRYAETQISEYEQMYSSNRKNCIDSILYNRLKGHELSKQIISKDWKSLIKSLAIARYTEQLLEGHLHDCALRSDRLNHMTEISFCEFQEKCERILNLKNAHEQSKKEIKHSLFKFFTRWLSFESTGTQKKNKTFVETARAFDSVSPQLYECIAFASQSRINFNTPELN